MTFQEQNISQTHITIRQRWSNYFIILFGIIALILSFNLRQNTRDATTTYVNNQIGITALYPAGWLIDENSDDYVFRVQNIQEIGFKTTFQVSVRPSSTSTTPRAILDILTMSRAQTLAAYRVLAVDAIQLDNDTEATSALYTYVATNSDPFLQTVPSVVLGLDILTIRRGQAIIITLRSNADNFETNRARFEQFVTDLEF